jgi:hypothetical protein
MKLLNISSLVVVGAVTMFLSARAPAASSATDSTSAAPGKDYACGDKGKPPCPMQGWMKTNMAPAAASGDTAALAKALDYVSSHAPPGLADWTAIAKKGAEAAKAGNVDGAKASCKTCHDKYKAQYKADMRDRAF